MCLWGHVISIFSVSNAVSSLTRLCKIIWFKPSEFPLIRTSSDSHSLSFTPSLSLLARHTLLRYKPEDVNPRWLLWCRQMLESSCKDKNLPFIFLLWMPIPSFSSSRCSSSAFRHIWGLLPEQDREKITKAYCIKDGGGCLRLERSMFKRGGLQR